MFRTSSKRFMYAQFMSVSSGIAGSENKAGDQRIK